MDAAIEFPDPDCEMGYSLEYLEEILGEEKFKEFTKWHAGQTGSICDGRRYDHEARAYFPTDCAGSPHSFVAYSWDVLRWLGIYGQSAKDWWD